MDINKSSTEYIEKWRRENNLRFEICYNKGVFRYFYEIDGRTSSLYFFIKDKNEMMVIEGEFLDYGYR